MYIKDLSVCVL